MANRFKCPACNASLNAPDDKTGKRIHCPRCGQEMRIPPPPRGESIPWALSEEAEPTKAIVHAAPASIGPPKVVFVANQSKRSPALLIMSVLCVAMITVLVLFVIKFGSVKDGKATMSVDRPFVTINDIWFYMLTIGLPASYFIMLAWIVKDCRNRSVDNGIMWMIIIAVFHIFGLIIYLSSRPDGSLIHCERCANKRLPYVRYCPHCKHDVGTMPGMPGIVRSY